MHYVPKILGVKVEIQFSYGLFGYILRYAGWIIMLTMLLFFSSFASVIILSGYYLEKPVSSTILLVAFSTMSVFCYKGTIYFFKYAKSFTNEYVLNNEQLTINPHKTSSASYSWESLSQITYRIALKIFEIEFNEGTVVVLMNNGRYETPEFLKLKKFLTGGTFKTNQTWF